MENWKIPEALCEQEREFFKVSCDLAEKDLKGISETSQAITNRAFQVVAALVPMLTISVTTIIKSVVEQTQTVYLICGFVGSLCGIIALILLLLIIIPRGMYNVGIHPSHFLKEEYFGTEEDAKLNVEYLYKYTIEEYQHRINYMLKQNAQRVREYQIALWFVTGAILSVFFIAFLYYLFNA